MNCLLLRPFRGIQARIPGPNRFQIFCAIAFNRFTQNRSGNILTNPEATNRSGRMASVENGFKRHPAHARIYFPNVRLRVAKLVDLQLGQHLMPVHRLIISSRPTKSCE